MNGNCILAYRGVHLPIAFGLLPDKSENSYKIFVVLLMEAVKKLDTRITIKRMMMDFELNIHKAFAQLFKTRWWVVWEVGG